MRVVGRSCRVLVCWLLLSSSVFAQSPDLVVHRLLGNSKITLVREALDKDYPNILSDTNRFAAGPAQAPAVFLEAIQKLGLEDVRTDGDGNVVGVIRGSGNGRLVLVEVRLPAVVSGNGSVPVRTLQEKMLAPGIADARSPAVLLGLIRALRSAKAAPASDILFVASPGPTGVLPLLENGLYKDRVNSFISLQALGANQIVHASPGIRHYQVHVAGANAAVAVSAFLKALEAWPTVHAQAPVQNGSSGLALDLESRFAVLEDIEPIDAEMKAALQRIQAEAGEVQADMQLLHEDPAAQTHVSLNLVQLAAAVTKESGSEPEYETEVSDAGVAMRLGIPAIALGFGEVGGSAYTADEWIDIGKESTLSAETRVLSVLLAAAGLR